MQSYNDIPNSGAFSAIVSAINANFQLTKQKLEELEHVGLEGFFGVWDTAAHLSEAYPNPQEGQWAYVYRTGYGAALPWNIYIVSNGQWADSGDDYTGSVEISNKADQSALTALSIAFDAFKSAGYDFGGVANPSSTPSQSSGVSRRAFLALTPGTYTGFSNSIVLGSGEIGIITTTNGGSSWSISTYDIAAKSIVGGYDSTPTEDSTKPVTSGGVYDALDALQTSLESEIAAVNPTFHSGENIGEVEIAYFFAGNDYALPTEGAVKGAILNTITVSQMNAMNTLPNRPTYRKSDKPARYIVTNTSGADTFKVGVLDVISDATGQVLTQVLTTHYTLTNNGALSTTVDDEHVFQYYRTCGGGTTGDVAAWGSWKRVNSDAWTSAIAQIVSDLSDYCLKADYYDKSTIDDMLEPIHSFNVIVADALPQSGPSAATQWKLYLVPSTRQQSGRTTKDEFITIKENGQYRWELIGSTDIDMSQYSTTAEMNTAISGAITLALASYYTKTQIDTMLGSYYTKTQVDTLLGGKQDTISDLATIRSGAAAGATAVQPANVGYFECSTAAGTAAKTISASGYSLITGSCLHIKMTNANTANNATLNINSTGAKALYYKGVQASSTNSWRAGDVLEVYYDGTQYQCASVGGSADMVWYDNSGSGLNAENVQEAIDEIAEDVSTYRQILDNCYHEAEGGESEVYITNSDLQNGDQNWQSTSKRIVLKRDSLVSVDGCLSVNLLIPTSSVASDSNIDRATITLYNANKSWLSTLDLGWKYFSQGNISITIDLTDERYAVVKYVGVYFGSNNINISPSSVNTSGIVFTLVTPTYYTTKAVDEEALNEVADEVDTHTEILENCYHYREGEQTTIAPVSVSDLGNTTPSFSGNSARIALKKASLINVEGKFKVQVTYKISSVLDANIDRATLSLYDASKNYLTELNLGWRYFNGSDIVIEVNLKTDTYSQVAYVGFYFGCASGSISTSSIDPTKIDTVLSEAVQYVEKAVDEQYVDERIYGAMKVLTPFDWNTAQITTSQYLGNKIELSSHSYTSSFIGLLQGGVNSRQGGAAYGDYLFQFHNTLENICVFDLSTGTNVDKLTLTANPSCHAGSGGFSTVFYDSADPFPLLYISSMDERKVYVYRITGEVGSLSIQRVQTITLDTTYFLPNIAIDNSNGRMVVFAYTQNSWSSSTNNDSIVMSCAIPSHTLGDVTVQDFEYISVIPFIYAEQGAFAENGKLYLSYGNTSINGGIIVFDYLNREVTNLIGVRAIGNIEPEACVRWGDSIVFTIQTGNVLKLDF